MRTRKVNSSSWYYRVADGMGFDSGQHDWCAFWRRVMFGCLLIVCSATIAVVLGSFIVIVTSEVLGWAAASLVSWQWLEMSERASITLFIYMILAGVGALIGIVRYLNENGLPDVGFSRSVGKAAQVVGRTNFVPQDTKDFVRDAYHSFKDKYCYKIEVE